MKTNILYEIIKPEDCIIAFGIPLIEGGDEIDEEYSYNKIIERCKNDSGRFIQQVRHNSSRDHYDLIEYKELFDGGNLLKKIRSLGVNILFDTSKSDINSLFSGKYKVVIIFTHWHNNMIELYDGLIPVNEVVNKFPVEGEAHICDLSICQSEPLAGAIKLKRNNYYVHYSGQNIDVKTWLYIYIY